MDIAVGGFRRKSIPSIRVVSRGQVYTRRNRRIDKPKWFSVPVFLRRTRRLLEVRAV